MPGDDLLFQRLSVSTIGAVRFHGRVRDGIGWGTDAMVTKQYGLRLLDRVFDAVLCANLAIRRQSFRCIPARAIALAIAQVSRLPSGRRRTDIDSAGSQA